MGTVRLKGRGGPDKVVANCPDLLRGLAPVQCFVSTGNNKAVFSYRVIYCHPGSDPRLVLYSGSPVIAMKGDPLLPHSNIIVLDIILRRAPICIGVKTCSLRDCIHY